MCIYIYICIYICNNREGHLVGGLALAAEFRFLSCQDYTEIYKNGKGFKTQKEIRVSGRS